MKILFIVEHFPCLSETFVLNQVTGLIDAGHDVRIYALGKPDSPVTHEDMDVYHLWDKIYYPLVDIPYSKIQKLKFLFLYLPKLIKKYGFAAFSVFNIFKFGLYAQNGNLFFATLRFLDMDWNPDVAITHFGCLGLFPACWKQMRALQAPFVTFFHAHEISPYTNNEISKIYRVLFEQKDLLLPISYYWKKKLEVCGANPSRVHVHRMGVDLKRFEFVKAQPVSEKIKILSVGRFTGQKGYEYALKGVAEFRDRTSVDIEYNIIGTGGLEQDLKRLVNDLHLENVVTFMGPQPQQVVKEKLKNANVFLLPSVRDEYGMMEGIPVAIMESMAMGVPVISTFHSGIPELIEDNVSGLLCEERNALEIAEKLEMLLQEPQLAETLSINARQKIEEEYDINILNRSLIDLLEREIS